MGINFYIVAFPWVLFLIQTIRLYIAEKDKTKNSEGKRVVNVYLSEDDDSELIKKLKGTKNKSDLFKRAAKAYFDEWDSVE